MASREPSTNFGVYRDVFEQSILNRDANRPWNFVASLSAEVLIVSLALFIPLAYSDRLPVFHWENVVMRPAPPPLPMAPARSPTGTSTGLLHESIVRPSFVPNRPANGPIQSASALEGEAPPSIGGISVGNAPGLSGALVIATPVLAPPPKAVAHASAPVRVGGTVQMAKLIHKVLPEYPALARSARISGVVHLIGTIGKDGSIRNLQLVDGHPMLARAALQAVAQWIYEPTLLNGEPVEVIAPIEVSFTLGN
jgi:periplasmic protein TonB